MNTKWSAYILLSNRLTKVEFVCESNLRQDAEQRCKELYGVTDVRQLTRISILMTYQPKTNDYVSMII